MTIQYDPQKVTDWLTPLEKVYARQSRQLDTYHQQLRERDRQEEAATINLPEMFQKLASFSQSIASAKQANERKKAEQKADEQVKWEIERIKKIQDPESPVRFIVGTPQTGGYGITLTGASTMIYYSNGYDLEKRQQSEARIDRIGQEKPMTYIDIMAEDTVDTKIVKSLRQKVNIATEIMGEELKQWI